MCVRGGEGEKQIPNLDPQMKLPAPTVTAYPNVQGHSVQICKTFLIQMTTHTQITHCAFYDVIVQ